MAIAGPSATGLCFSLREKLPCVVGVSPKTLFLRYRNHFFIHLSNRQICRKERKRKESHKIMYFHLSLIIGLSRAVEVLGVGYSILRPNQLDLSSGIVLNITGHFIVCLDIFRCYGGYKK